MPRLSIRPTGLIMPDDVPAHEVGPALYTGAENIAFRDVYPERIGGWQPIYDANPSIAAPLYLQPYESVTANFWMYGTASEVGVTDSAGTHTNLSPVSGKPSGTDSEDWNGCELNGVPVVNWGSTGGPHSWDGNVLSNVAPLTDWPSGYAARVIRAHKFYLIALNISGSVEWPSVAIWSDSAAPGNLPTSWTPGAGSDAGSLSFGDVGGGGIIDGLTLRDQFMVYRGHSTYSMQYVGGSLIFGQRSFLQTSGILATNSVIEWNGNHCVLTDGDVIMHDGNQVTSIVDKATRASLFRNLDSDNYDKSYIAHNFNNNEIWICYPEVGATYPTRALVFDTNTGRVQEKDVLNVSGGLSYRTVRYGSSGSGSPHITTGNITDAIAGDTWTSVSTNWNTITGTWNDSTVQEANDGLVGINFDDSELVVIDTVETVPSGSNITAVLTKQDMDLDDPQSVKLVTEVWPRIIAGADQTVQIRVGGKMAPDDPISWSAFVDFTIGSTDKIDTFVTGRFISVQMQSTDGGRWVCTGFDLNVEPAGRY